MRCQRVPHCLSNLLEGPHGEHNRFQHPTLIRHQEGRVFLGQHEVYWLCLCVSRTFCTDVAPSRAQMGSALEGLYRASGEHKLRHHFLVATDHAAERCDRTLALGADAAQCLAPQAMILPREGWEGLLHTQTPVGPS